MLEPDDDHRGMTSLDGHKVTIFVTRLIGNVAPACATNPMNEEFPWTRTRENIPYEPESVLRTGNVIAQGRGHAREHGLPAFAGRTAVKPR